MYPETCIQTRVSGYMYLHVGPKHKFTMASTRSIHAGMFLGISGNQKVAQSPWELESWK